MARQPITTVDPLAHFAAGMIPTVNCISPSVFLRFIFINHYSNDACLIIYISDPRNMRFKMYSLFIIPYKIHAVCIHAELEDRIVYQMGFSVRL